jgi:phosphonate transport system ATP-binding protein
VAVVIAAREQILEWRAMITFKSIRKEFSAKVALDSVTLIVAKPQMIGIIGRSGAGKSTLLRVMNRLTPATSGELLVHGRNVLALKGAELRRWQRDCAMIFQQFNLVPRLDVLTNVMLGRLNAQPLATSLLKQFSRDDRMRAIHALDQLGIADTALQRAETLSGGQQQRVAIARAIVQEPSFILADEPIASLDPMNAKIVMDALRAIHDGQGLTVIANLHTLDTARAYCERIIGMRDGRIVFDGTAGELDESAAREIYGAGTEFNEATTSTSIVPLINGFRRTQGDASAAIIASPADSDRGMPPRSCPVPAMTSGALQQT